MPNSKNSDSGIIIAQNQEEWNRLLFLLKDPEPNILWINCDTALLKKPLHNALMEHLPQFKPYDIDINEKTESLNRIILGDGKNKISKDDIIHVFGLEDAIKSTDFIGNLNFQRDSLFRDTPATIIFWADFATTTVVTHKAYDFWSWVVFTFNFKTPEGLLTSRQKGFQQELILENTTISLLNKDSQARIRHLEDEWDEFLKSVNGKPSTIKQMKDAVVIARALAIEYKDDGMDKKAIEILENILNLNSKVLIDKDKNLICNDLGISYSNLGDSAKAEALYESALKGNIKLLGEENLEVARNKSNLAVAYKELGKLDLAKKMAEDALSTFLQIIKEDHPEISTMQSNLAMIYEGLGELENAKELLEKALKNDIKFFGEYHPDVSIKRSNLGVVYCRLGEFTKARDIFQKALESDIKDFAGNLNHRSIAIRYYNLSYTYLYLNDRQMAIENMQKAYEVYQNINGENSADTQDCLAFLKHLEQQSPSSTS